MNSTGTKTVADCLKEAKLLKEKGQIKEAALLYRHALSINPNHAGAYQARGNFLFTQQDYEAARSSFEQAIELGSAAPIVRFRLGRIAQKQNQHKKAIGYFKEAIALNDQNPAFYVACGDSYLKCEQSEQAITAYQQAIALNPDLPGPHRALGVIQFIQGQYRDAQQSYKRAIKLGNKPPKTCFHMGRISQELGNLAAAYDWYQEAISLKPNNAQFYYYLGTLQTQRSNTAQARASYTKALDINPHFKPALDAVDALSFINTPLNNTFENSLFADSFSSVPVSSQMPQPNSLNKDALPLNPKTTVPNQKVAKLEEETASPSLFQRLLKRLRQ